MAPDRVDYHEPGLFLQKRLLNLTILGLATFSTTFKMPAPSPYREIKISLARHDQALGFDGTQAPVQVTTISDLRDIPRDPSVQEGQQVVGVPKPEKPELPFLAQESPKIGVSWVHGIQADSGTRLKSTHKPERRYPCWRNHWPVICLQRRCVRAI